MIFQTVRNKTLMLFFAAFLAVPAVGMAQQLEDDQPESYEVPELEVPEASNAGSGVSGQEEIVSGGGLGIQHPRPSANTGGSDQLSNPTPDGRDPGGNPDVPFDPVMNTVFLMGSVVFAAVVVYRRRSRLKPVRVKS